MEETLIIKALEDNTWEGKTMQIESLIKLARRNLEAFHNEADLAEYLAFLFSELAILDRDWERKIGTDIKEMEG